MASKTVGADTPPAVLLWADGAPHTEGKTAEQVVKTSASGERVVTGVNKPSLTLFIPEKSKATGIGVLIAPGGGHRQLSFDSEGCFVGQGLAERGGGKGIIDHERAVRRGCQVGQCRDVRHS